MILNLEDLSFCFAHIVWTPFDASAFGTKVVPPKRIMKMLPELFDHQDQNVRACAKGLTIELCRWIGKDAVKNILFDKMRDTMKKELEMEVDNVVVGSKPTRKIRSEQALEVEQAAVTAAENSKPSDDAPSSGLQDIDEYELVDPVDILTPLSKSVFWEGVVSSIPSYWVVLLEVMVSVYCVHVLTSFSTSSGRSFWAAI
jgi:hypothetical protein